MKRATGSMWLLLSVVWLGWPCSVAAQAAGAPDATAQSTSGADPLAPVRSLGKPPVWKPFAGGYFGLDSTEDEKKNGGGAFFGVYKDLLPSIVGIGVSAEGYLGGYSGVSGVNGGVRALLELRGLLLKAGIDYDVQRDDTSFILSLTMPFRRGGILGHGTHFRVDWLPGRGNSWNFGLQIPLEPHMGNTRPRHTDVALPRGQKAGGPRPGPAGEAAMAEAREAARDAMLLNTMFWRDHRSDRLKSLETSRAEMREFKARISQTGALRPRGMRMENEVQILHDQLRPRLRARRRGHAGGREGDGRAARRPRARGPARRGRLSLQPPVRAVQEARGVLGPRGAGAGALRRAARRVAARRAGPDAVRLLFDEYLQALENLRDWGMKQSLGRLARDVDPAPARAAARAVRHAAGDRRHPLAGAGDAARRRQPRLLLERAAVAADAAPQHPRRARLPRALAPRLRRRGRRRRRRHDQLLHHGRGLPEGPHRARARVRRDRASCPST